MSSALGCLGEEHAPLAYEHGECEHCKLFSLLNICPLIEVVNRAVARLQLDWPQEQETHKRSKLEDRFLSSGQEDGPERRSLTFFEDFHEELNCS